MIARIGAAILAAGLWQKLGTDWLCLDTELMPWSAKAQSLIDAQYLPVGKAAIAGTNAAVEFAARAKMNGVDIGDFLTRLNTRAENARLYDMSWRRYVRPVNGIDDLRVAPFHMMTSEGSVHSDKPHDWHMAIFTELATADPALLVATQHHVMDLGDDAQVAAITAWWEALTANGGEGMVVKPLDFVARQEGDLAAGNQMPWTGISANHLWPGLHDARQSRPAT